MWRTFADLRHALASGTTTPAYVIATSLNAITGPMAKLNAFVATAKMGAEDNNAIPLAVKDNFCTSDLNTTCGSRMLEHFSPGYDATVVARAKKWGACVVGKTNMDEFGMGSGSIDSFHGPVRSLLRSGVPHEWVDVRGKVLDVDTDALDDDFVVAGGSTGGGAVAVAAGVCLAALGSDTGGSARIPAAWNGVVGLKPAYGYVSRHGLVPLVNSLDAPSIMTRCVDDAFELYDAIKGVDPNDSTTIENSTIKGIKSLDQIRVGIPKDFYCHDMSSEVLELWSDVADLLERNGIKVCSVSMPHVKYSVLCYSILNPCEVASNMARYDGLQFGLRGEETSSTEALFASGRRKGFNEVVRSRILAGNYFLLRQNCEHYFTQACKVRRLIKNDFDAAFNEVDLLLTPVTLGPAPKYSEFKALDSRTQTTKQDFCTQPVNLAGLPAMCVPLRLSEKLQLPLSLQVISEVGGESNMKTLCQFLEEEAEFPYIRLKNGCIKSQ